MSVLQLPAVEALEVAGECQARPEAILVHNPVVTGAFRTFDSIANDDLLESEALFRARPNPILYSEHHNTLVRTIAARIDRVIYLSDLIPEDPNYRPAADNPNQVFTRDSLITLPWLPGGYFRARLKPAQRRRESETMAAAVERLGLREIVQPPDDIFLEGGDVIPFAYGGRRCLLIGYGPRSTPTAIDFLQQSLLPKYADELIAIRLASWRMNLDGGFVPAAEDVIVSDTLSVVAAEMIEPHGRSALDLWGMLRDLDIRVIETTPEESIYCQSCNCLCLGGRHIVYYDLCPRVAELLEQHDIQVHRVPGAELIKGRGGPRCMTRPIYSR